MEIKTSYIFKLFKIPTYFSVSTDEVPWSIQVLKEEKKERKTLFLYQALWVGGFVYSQILMVCVGEMESIHFRVIAFQRY